MAVEIGDLRWVLLSSSEGGENALVGSGERTC
jgi:hypothetical protein